MIEAHGGNPRIVDDRALMAVAPGRDSLRALHGGFVMTMAAEAIGRASNALGAGRTRVGDAVDHAVGVMMLAAPGDEVRAGQPLLEFHHRDGRGLDEAVALCRAAVTIGDAPPASRPKVIAEVRA